MNKKYAAIIKNTRPLQIIYHVGLVSIGVGLSFVFVDQTLPQLRDFSLLLIAVTIAWMSTVFFNDVADIEIDRISNPHRPLPSGIITSKESDFYGVITLITSLVISAMISWSTAILLASYHFLSWIYSMPPLRLKQTPLLATFLAACASLSIVIAGFLLSSPLLSLSLFPVPIAAILLVGYTLCLPLKDFRDINGDRADGVRTIPVIFGESTARKILAANLAISFILSALLLGFYTLIVPATLASLAAIAIMVSKKNGTFLCAIPFMLPLIFSITFFYGITLTYLLFLR